MSYKKITKCRICKSNKIKKILDLGNQAFTGKFPALKNKKTNMPVVPEGAKQSTLNINSIHGGESEQDDDYTGLHSPCVPDRC